MPYADAAANRAYQNEYIKKRRLAWIAEHGPCVDCGTWDDLVVDHVDASTKVTHRVWSWAKTRRDAELAKCVTRCHPCHVAKTVRCGENPRGEQHNRAILTSDQVREVRRRVAEGESQAEVGRLFGVSRQYVWELVRRRSRTYE